MANTPNQLFPTYTFQVNLPVLQAGSWSQPYVTTNVQGGSVDQTLAAAIPQQFTSWLCNLFPGCQFIAEKAGFQFTVSGLQAVYLKNLYCLGTPSDMLILVASS